MNGFKNRLFTSCQNGSIRRAMGSDACHRDSLGVPQSQHHSADLVNGGP